MTRLTLVSFVFLAGCGGAPTGPSGSAGLDSLIAALATDIAGPGAEVSTLDCPDLEGDTPGDYTCTSTVDGHDVTWAMAVTDNPVAADSFRVNLVPDYGSPSLDAEYALRRSFRDQRGVVLDAVSCPPSDQDPYVAVCRATVEGVAFDVEFQSQGESFGYQPRGVGLRGEIEQAIAAGLQGNDGPAVVVDCDAPLVFETPVGLEVLCQARAPQTGETATVRYTTLEGGRFAWDIVPPPGS